MSAYWPLIFIVLAIAMAVGPIMLMRPSHRDKRIAKLRQQAAMQGLHVRLDDYESQKVAVYSAPAKLPKSTPSWQLIRRTYAHGIHFHNHWQLTKRNDTIPATIKQELIGLLDELSEDIVGLEVKSSIVGLWWNEKAGGNSLEEIMNWLKQLEGLVAGAGIKAEQG